MNTVGDTNTQILNLYVARSESNNIINKQHRQEQLLHLCHLETKRNSFVFLTSSLNNLTNRFVFLRF